jgi:YesN/AraC family two-component response regulator
MVAEDDEICRTLFKFIICRNFPDVTLYLAADGREGVKLFKKHLPQIVITDLNMPGMDGIEMSLEIKAIKVDTRIVVVTAYDDEDYRGKCEKIGPSDYLTKPIVISTLLAVVERCVAGIAAESKKDARAVARLERSTLQPVTVTD